MLYTKSDAGAQAIKDRHAVEITRGQRSALILFDGQRSVRAVLDATAALGVTAADVDALVAMGLLRRVGAIDGESVTDASEETPTPEPIQADASLAASPELSDEERARRYRLVYPLATQLTAHLGLRGFTLNLAVESAQGFDGLTALLPRLRAAVGDERLRPLEDALQGR